MNIGERWPSWPGWRVLLARQASKANGARMRTTRASGLDVPMTAEDDRVFGCGWFDSSHDLRRGLAVIEHDDGDLPFAVERMLEGCSAG